MARFFAPDIYKFTRDQTETMTMRTNTTTHDATMDRAMKSEASILTADELLAALTAGEFDASVASEAAELKAALTKFLRACGENV